MRAATIKDRDLMATTEGVLHLERTRESGAAEDQNTHWLNRWRWGVPDVERVRESGNQSQARRQGRLRGESEKVSSIDGHRGRAPLYSSWLRYGPNRWRYS